MKIFISIIVAFFSLSKLVIACDINNKIVEDEVSIWLGNNSEFSQAYINGKCVLDKALNDLPVNQRKIIANLIAKSYQFAENKNKEVMTYNY